MRKQTLDGLDLAFGKFGSAVVRSPSHLALYIVGDVLLWRAVGKVSGGVVVSVSVKVPNNGVFWARPNEDRRYCLVERY